MTYDPNALVAFERQYLGYREGPNNDTPFGTWIGAPRAAWCDSFQHFCAYSLGLRFAGSQFGDKGDAAVAFTRDWHIHHGAWGATPRFGAFVCYDWGLRGHWGDMHIELWLGQGNEFRVLGGNVHDAVVEQVRPDSERKYIMGWCYLDNVLSVAGPAPAPAPAPSSPFTPWPGRNIAVTSPLMHGDDVRMLQHQLNTALNRVGGSGYHLQEDGVYGKLSWSAVHDYQHRHGLTEDGIVGPHTWNSLFN